jgi:hypothetical protein
MKRYFLIIPLLVFLFSSCEEELLNEKYENTPLDNYELFWNEFDRFYGAFEAKNINWDSLKTVYGHQLSENSTDQQLYKAMCGLLNELNDGHADLFANKIGYYRSWNRRNKSYFSDFRSTDFNHVVKLQSTIRSNYLKGKYKFGNYSNWLFFWGTIPYEGRQIGYISIPTFNINDYPNDFIQQAIDSFNQHDAVIIDLRYNGGGTTEAFVSSLNSFASEKKCYMQSQFRDGSKHTDFTKKEEHWTNPHANGLKPIPIAILMNSYSASSSDHFILGMKTQSNVITVGDSTCGAFSAVLERVLPNGWKYRLGAQVIYAPNGSALTDKNGNYLEGLGIAPDYYVTDQWEQVLKGNDLPLDKALKELSESIAKYQHQTGSNIYCRNLSIKIYWGKLALARCIRTSSRL